MSMDGKAWWRFRPGLLVPGPEEAAELEVQHHLAELIDRLVADGMDPVDARREAERRFGDPGAYRARLEQTERRRRRTMRRTAGWAVLGTALAGTLRDVRRHPGFASAVVLTLGLGIGANAAMFAILDRLLFQPPAHVVDADRVLRVMVERNFIGRVNRSATIAFPDFEDLLKHTGLGGAAALTGSREATLGSGPEATRVRVVQASHELFPLLGARPALGRFYGAEEDRGGAPGTAVLSQEYWRRALGAAPDAIGRTLEISGVPYTVIGIAPSGFTGVDLAPVDVWVPIRAANGGEDRLTSRDFFWMRAVVRLGEGVTVAAAEQEATRVHRAGWQESIAAGHYDPGVRVALDPLIEARGPDASAESKVARWLGGVSFIVLLIACANVANLLLARGTRRRREVAVRLALGVERGRMIGLMITESVVLALLGAGVALGMAIWGGAAIRKVLLPGVHFPGPAIGSRILLFTLAAAVLAGLAAGIGPALQATRADLARDLASGGAGSFGRRQGARGLLTVGQAALAVLLLVGAGLFVRSVAEVRRLDLGLDVDNLALVTLELSSRDVDRSDVYARAMERLRAVPGVESVAATTSPFQYAFATALTVPGWDSLPRLPGGGPYYQQVTPGYFATVGLRLLQGREPLETDGPGDPKVTVVSRTMATTLWPEGNALGRCIYMGGGRRGEEGEALPPPPCTTVVGVVEDASRGSLEEEPHMAYYLPAAQHPEERIMGVYARIGGDSRTVAAEAATALRTIDPAVRYATVRPLRDILDPQARAWTLGAAMFTVFGLLALLVAAIGLYSVLAFDVAQRSRELGIRTALGAERGRLLAVVMADGVRLAGLGVLLGLAAALVAGRYAEGLLFEVSPRDPAVLAAVALTLLAVAALASLVPGLRATRADPMVALRSE